VANGHIVITVDNMAVMVYAHGMIKRHLSPTLAQYAKKFPVVAVIGPRQSGKTTLTRAVFPHYAYVSLEDMDTREFASSDPRGFLAAHKDRVIIDEIQRVPHLTSYIQTIVDANQGRPGQYILTGSHNFLIMQTVSQSLAGRIAILKLLPLSIHELLKTTHSTESYEEYLWKGFYPRLYDKKLTPNEWYPNYIQTYLERDVRLIKNIPNLASFQSFVQLCAGRIGHVLNLSSLGNDCGITHNTAKAWLSILEASFIVFLLRPYHKNYNKRLTKSPKLYFYDPGLACSLLGIQNSTQIESYYQKGNMFEGLVISELLKSSYNKAIDPRIYYWRDKIGNEIDCLIDRAGHTISIEIKAGKTITVDYFKGLRYWQKISNASSSNSLLVYGGDSEQKRSNARIVNWQNTHTI